jgi:hypothetical protein
MSTGEHAPDALSELRAFLAQQPAGPLVAAGVLHLLAACWDEIEGGEAEAMRAWKLGRAEQVAWQPPGLSFIIERHGGTARGSTRADLQRWEVDVDRAVAGCETVGRRQVREMATRLNLQGLADEVADALSSGNKHRAIEQLAGGRAKIAIDAVIPSTGFKQTVESRCQRFTAALRNRLTTRGWREVASNVWERVE